MIPEKKQLLFIASISLLFSCRLFQPTAHFFITNASKAKSSVDLQVSIGGKKVFDDTIRYTDVIPDFQYTPSQTLPKGKYTIFVSGDDGKIQMTQPIDLGGDRWIFITHIHEAPVDSIQKATLTNYFWYDTLFLNRKLSGTPSKILIYVMSKEPRHM